MDLLSTFDYEKITLPRKAKELLSNIYPKKECIEDKNYDLVYIVKEDDNNPDLVMSLRSIDKFCSFRKVWIIGYKPSWVQNVEYIPTVQDGNKWENSCINWQTACECKDISDDFILMNDDFFALKPIIDWKKSLNLALGTIDEEAEKFRNTKFSKWQGGFIYASELLDKLGCNTRYNYEIHTPIIINKENYLNFLKLKPIEDFMKTHCVLHKRSIYKNLFPDQDEPRITRDVKIRLNCDLLSLWLCEDWLSVFDGVLSNYSQFPKTNAFLLRMFPEKSRFEK